MGEKEISKDRACLYTLEQTLDDQRSLDRLCQDRPLKTNEIFRPNAYYGIDQVIKTYIDAAPNYPLKMIFPHGIRFNAAIWDHEFASVLPVIAAYDQVYEKVLKNHNQQQRSKKVIINSACPFHYVCALLKGDEHPGRKGTIFFPQHSTHHVTVLTDFEAIADKLLDIQECYQPVTVCIYWRDYLLGHHIPFEKKGLRFVSAGNIFDPFFLHRLYHLCATHQYSASNNIGSHVFYSSAAGCEFIFFDINVSCEMEDENNTRKRISFMMPDKHNELIDFFRKVGLGNFPEKQKVIDFYMGTQYLQSPAELLKTIKYADKIYRRRLLSQKVKKIPYLIRQRLKWTVKKLKIS